MTMTMLEMILINGFCSGGASGALAWLFAFNGVGKILGGDLSLETALLMLVCTLIFVFVYQIDQKDTRRKYNFEKHVRTSDYYDPTLDVDSRKSLEDFKQRPDVSSEYINYAPKETADQYRHL